jgi:hypothetical protein
VHLLDYKLDNQASFDLRKDQKANIFFQDFVGAIHWAPAVGGGDGGGRWPLRRTSIGRCVLADQSSSCTATDENLLCRLLSSECIGL